MANIFTDWGSSQSLGEGGITIQKGKRSKRLKTKREPQGGITGKIGYDKRVKSRPVKSGGISYGSRSKPEKSGGISYKKPNEPETVGGISYGRRKEVQPKISGGISYGEPNKPEISGGIGTEKLSYNEKQLMKSGGISFESSGKETRKQKPLFGEDAPLTVSEKEAKEIIKQEKRRIKAIEQESKRKQKAEVRAKKVRAKRWKQSLKFNRRNPIAKRLRKLF